MAPLITTLYSTVYGRELSLPTVVYTTDILHSYLYSLTLIRSVLYRLVHFFLELFLNTDALTPTHTAYYIYLTTYTCGQVHEDKCGFHVPTA